MGAMKKLVLASGSPRRRLILQDAGFVFDTFTSQISETLEKNLTLPEQISSLARRKAEAVREMLGPKSRDVVLLGADTVVHLDGELLEKPRSGDEAIEHLRRLSGREHEVLTGMAVVDGASGVGRERCEKVRVQFRELSDREIQSYVKTGEPMDKAGAYGIQGLGGRFIHKVSGRFDAVMGLSIASVAQLLEELGVVVGRVDPFPELETNLNRVLSELRKFSLEAATGNLGPQVIAVTKTHPARAVRRAFYAGVTHFGENYVQEFVAKHEELKDLPVQWHFIGHLQSNKVKDVVGRAHWIHSVDSVKLAGLISRKAEECGLQQKVMLQVNIAREASKSGFSPEGLAEAWPTLRELPGLDIRGLMVIPPPPESSDNGGTDGYWFRTTKELAGRIYAGSGWSPELSMGMSQDYGVALAEGATWIRIGTQFFGERQKSR